ncbi:MAG: response regulator [Candidatus Sumerlaeota bacterium]|nr:response regulator [Candidatus Sumerlaeota bacterium]
MDRQARILAVDDEEINLRLYTAILAPLNYEVISAHNGKEALEQARAGNPDVILMDAMMPVLNGFEALKVLRESEDTRQTPVVIVSGLQEVSDRVRAFEAGADDFLTKPVDESELKARVRSLVKVKAYNDHARDYRMTLEAEVSKRTEELAEALRQVESASLETIYRLSKAAEYRDKHTGAHLQRMSHYAAAVARQMGQDESFVKALLYAAPMHDIGKIGIPDRILLKPGKLDPDEWEIMKQHAAIGAKILEGSNAPVIQLAREIALAHHEKWDGSGYPAGLAGEAIPLSGRIATIADAYDALCSRRPYKAPLPAEQVLDILRIGRGRHYDPEAADAFFSARDRILAIQARYAD